MNSGITSKNFYQTLELQGILLASINYKVKFSIPIAQPRKVI